MSIRLISGEKVNDVIIDPDQLVCSLKLLDNFNQIDVIKHLSELLRDYGFPWIQIINDIDSNDMCTRLISGTKIDDIIILPEQIVKSLEPLRDVDFDNFINTLIHIRYGGKR